jgi:hypothetical protein
MKTSNLIPAFPVFLSGNVYEPFNMKAEMPDKINWY